MASIATTLKVGDKAPDFRLLDSNSKEVALSDFLGSKKIVLAFYRGDWCPFCNKQMKRFTRDYSRFQAVDAEIVAISVDGVDTTNKFVEKIGMPFPVLSDPQHQTIELYGVLGKKELRSREIAKPAIFIIDKQGVIRYRHIGKAMFHRPRNATLLRALREI